MAEHKHDDAHCHDECDGCQGFEFDDDEDIDNAIKLVLDDDMTFPKASIDPKLIKLQKDVTEFVTSVILKHEAEFFLLVKKLFVSKMEYLLGTTNKSIIEMIKETIVKFYNNLYFDIQNKKNTDLTKLVLEMCEFAEYGAHILLDKLFRLTVDAHLDVEREQLVIGNEVDYSKSILNQINVYLLSKNLLQILSKGEGEDLPFVIIPEGEKPFSIVIEKNIEN